MKIAIIGSRGYPSNYGGYESFIREVSERLAKMGVDVTVYCHKPLFTERPKVLNGIHLVYLPSIETKMLSQLSHSFLSLTHASISRYDLLFVVNSANGPLGWIPKLFGKKTVINVDGMEWLRPKWRGAPAKYFLFAAKMATKFYDCLVSDADEMRKVYLEYFGADSEVIAYGAPNTLSVSDDQRIAKRGLTSGKYYLIVGRLIPDNNSRMIAEGFLKSNSEKKLVIVGGVPYKDDYVNQIIKLAEKDSRLIVTGHINDREEIAELFQNSYMYIHGHEYGGTNPTMIEALGYKCAIMALNTRFNQEMLQNGQYGLYFEKSEASVCSLINEWDNRTEMVAKMREKAISGVTEKYKWDNVSSQYFQLFQRVMNESK